MERPAKFKQFHEWVHDNPDVEEYVSRTCSGCKGDTGLVCSRCEARLKSRYRKEKKRELDLWDHWHAGFSMRGGVDRL